LAERKRLQRGTDFTGILMMPAIEPINDDSSFVYDQLVIVRDIRCATVCPHHLLPVELVVHIGYLPGSKMLGISKFDRIAKEYCKPPRTQEEYTAVLAKTIHERLEAKYTYPRPRDRTTYTYAL